MKSSSVFFGAVLAGLYSSVASAAVYDFSFDDFDFKVLAQITIDASNDITKITGDVTGITTLTVGYGGPIAGLVTTGGTPPSPSTFWASSGGWIYDNVYYPNSDPVFDNDGVLFGFGSGNIANLYSIANGSGLTYVLSVNAPESLYMPSSVGGNLTVSAVPEPSTFAMMFVGFASLAYAGYPGRMRRRVPAAT
jgi:hypothetical protein